MEKMVSDTAAINVAAPSPRRSRQAQVVWVDTPNLWIAVLLVVVLAFLVLLWRVRL